MALIVWVYYSAIIVFVGAEVTQAYTRHYGSGIEPDEYAMPKQKNGGGSGRAGVSGVGGSGAIGRGEGGGSGTRSGNVGEGVSGGGFGGTIEAVNLHFICPLSMSDTLPYGLSSLRNCVSVRVLATSLASRAARRAW